MGCWPTASLRIDEALRLRIEVVRSESSTPKDYVFCGAQGRALTRHHAYISCTGSRYARALSHKVGPHALRHHAATSILKWTGDVELVRQVLRHESLAMTPARAEAEPYLAVVLNESPLMAMYRRRVSGKGCC